MFGGVLRHDGASGQAHGADSSGITLTSQQQSTPPLAPLPLPSLAPLRHVAPLYVAMAVGVASALLHLSLNLTLTLTLLYILDATVCVHNPAEPIPSVT